MSDNNQPPLDPTDANLQSFGYAPGFYAHLCHICDKPFIGDKLATRCRLCATYMWRASLIGQQKVTPPEQTTPPQQEKTWASYQSRVHAWMIECFGHHITMNKFERNHRFLEEALELVQAGGCPKADALQLVEYVYSREVGDKRQEVGGVAVTLAALCNAHYLELNTCAENELNRVWTMVEKIRAKQASKPKGSPLPQPAYTPEPPLPWLKIDLARAGDLIDELQNKHMELIGLIVDIWE